ncbi:MAG: YeeE/YedE family protein [Burkholderiales bacterium]|nr:YeeE/YedE family protein [Burkholderiales bacterium]
MNALRPPAAPARVRPFWNPLLAGVALGLVLLATFLATGHGLGATGASTRLSAWLGGVLAPQAAAANGYLGPLLEAGNPLPSWITWQVIGVALGAVASARLAGRFRLQLDGLRSIGLSRRALAALAGGVVSGFGARLAAGCTSGLGLSGAATLAIAAFVFLATFFAAGLLASRLVRGI